jgi:hypothetical protein
MENLIGNIIGFLLCIVGALFVYISSHMVEEKKRGKYIPLPWEKKEDGTE